MINGYKEATNDNNLTKKDRVVVIGNGAAGNAAIETIRSINKDIEIVVIDEEGLNIYYKPLLSHYIANDSVEKRLFLHDLKWYEENKINYICGKKVIGINTKNCIIEMSNGEKITYSKLIIATGGKAFIPPIKNSNIKGIYTLRTYNDAQNIKNFINQKIKNAVIIGGGLLGLELADEIKKVGINVSVVEVANRILPKQVDEFGSKIIEEKILSSGIKLITGNSVIEILGEEFAEGLLLSNGEKISADVVFISAGIRSNIKLAQDAGIACNRGIIVDENMRTNLDNIYAAGDVAEYQQINYAIWPEAIEQGKVAGANVVGEKSLYKHFIPYTMFNGLNTKVLSVGKIEDDDKECVNLILKDMSKGIYKRLIFKNDKFIGGIIIGENKGLKQLIKGLEEGQSKDEMINLL